MSVRIMEVLGSFLTALVIFIGFNGAAQLEKTEICIDSFNIYFESAKFTTSKTSELSYKLKNLSKESKYKIKLSGCTDSVGTVESNQMLATKRLNFVTEIINKFDSLIVIDTFNLGESKSIATIDNKNLRLVEIKIYKIDVKIEIGKPVVLDITFQPGNDHLMPGKLRALEELRDILKFNQVLKIELHGHVCCAFDRDNLSGQRAEKIKKYLISQGISESRITCFGHGNKKPKVKEVNAKTEEINRRVEVVFVDGSK